MRLTPNCLLWFIPRCVYSTYMAVGCFSRATIILSINAVFFLIAGTVLVLKAASMDIPTIPSVYDRLPDPVAATTFNEAVAIWNRNHFTPSNGMDNRPHEADPLSNYTAWIGIRTMDSQRASSSTVGAWADYQTTLVNMRLFGGGPPPTSSDENATCPSAASGDGDRVNECNAIVRAVNYTDAVLSTAATGSNGQGDPLLAGGMLLPLPPTRWKPADIVVSLDFTVKDGSSDAAADDPYNLLLPATQSKTSVVECDIFDDDGDPNCWWSHMSLLCKRTYGSDATYRSGGDGCGANDDNCGQCTYDTFLVSVCLAMNTSASPITFAPCYVDESTLPSSSSSSASIYNMTAGRYARYDSSSLLSSTRVAVTLLSADDPFIVLQQLSRGSGVLPPLVPAAEIQSAIDDAESERQVYYGLGGGAVAISGVMILTLLVLVPVCTCTSGCCDDDDYGDSCEDLCFYTEAARKRNYDTVYPYEGQGGCSCCECPCVAESGGSVRGKALCGDDDDDGCCGGGSGGYDYGYQQYECDDATSLVEGAPAAAGSGGIADYAIYSPAAAGQHNHFNVNTSTTTDDHSAFAAPVANQQHTATFFEAKDGLRGVYNYGGVRNTHADHAAPNTDAYEHCPSRGE